MARIVSLLGLLVMIFLAWVLSADRRRMNIRLILSGIALQFILAVFILRTSVGQLIFSYARILVTQLVGIFSRRRKVRFR